MHTSRDDGETFSYRPMYTFQVPLLLGYGKFVSSPSRSLTMPSHVPFVAARRVTPCACSTLPTETLPSTSSTVALGEWQVHKFGGSSLADAERIAHVAKIIMDQTSVSSKTFVVVSAVGGVTDALEAAVDAALVRDPTEHYLEAVEELAELHRTLVAKLLPADARESFLASLRANLKDMKDLLRATWIARSASARIRELIVGYGELWSAQILWAVLRNCHGLTCSWMDARKGM